MSLAYSDTVQMRAGSTPYAFDGNQTLRLNSRARRIVAMIVSHSLSTLTTDEAVGLMVRLQSNNWNGSKYFVAGWMHSSPPATNHSATGVMPTVLALDIPVKPDTTITVDITSILGATMTGTHDVTIQFLYDDGSTPSDILAKIGQNVVAAKGGSYGYSAALTTTTRTALTGNGTSLNIPPEATQIIGAVALMALDTAVTAAEEFGGIIEIDFGLAEQGKQVVALNGGSPGLGTEVEGGVPEKVYYLPLYIGNLPNRELQVNAYVTLLSAITGGADIALAIIWR